MDSCSKRRNWYSWFRTRDRQSKIFHYAKLDDVLRDLYVAQECFDERFRIRVVGKGYVLTSNERVCDARGQGPNRASPIEAERAAFMLATKFPPYEVQN